ncbi:MAG TPA: sigma-70 family RNA polymerase sigma factor [Nannocystaceae bacterium]|nr:sigma-70 family RNA polymerase sigma factor [Nannocystaceae bacterium]
MLPSAREAELCREWAPRIRLYGKKHLRSEDAARELVQCVLLALVEALRANRIEQPEHLDRYVLGICRNLADRIRRNDARAEPHDPATLDLAAALPEIEPLDFGAVMQCIARLEARARSVLHLSFQRERSADEIAESLGMTAGNVRVVRHRAVAALRRCLERGRAP